MRAIIPLVVLLGVSSAGCVDADEARVVVRVPLDYENEGTPTGAAAIAIESAWVSLASVDFLVPSNGDACIVTGAGGPDDEYNGYGNLSDGPHVGQVARSSPPSSPTMGPEDAPPVHLDIVQAQYCGIIVRFGLAAASVSSPADLIGNAFIASGRTPTNVPVVIRIDENDLSAVSLQGPEEHRFTIDGRTPPLVFVVHLDTLFDGVAFEELDRGADGSVQIDRTHNLGARALIARNLLRSIEIRYRTVIPT